ncbi:molybdopterin-dependent oxidoreductase [Chloroflexota bacterium]
MKSRREVLTFCHMCPGRCTRKAVIKDGRIVEWNRDLESGLSTEFCPTTKGLAVMEISSHPDRLRYPQKRLGARGEGKWQRISWDEALDTIAEKLKDLKAKYSPESLAMCLGEPHQMEFAFAQRFATYFGTPNVATPGGYCGTPSGTAYTYTLGSSPVCDDAATPKLIVFWGCNLIHTSGGLTRDSLRAHLLNGAKLAVIDPKRLDIAKRADMWVRLRPQSDGALALGLLKVIIEEKLYDEQFVANWTVGFDELQKHVGTFTLDDVERVSWVPREHIVRFARLYAESKPATIQIGNGLDTNVHCVQSMRAIGIISAICGNVNVPGGDIFLTPAPYTRAGHFFLSKEFPRNVDKTIGNEFKVAMRSLYVPTQSLVRAILEEKPYPIKAAWVIVSDPLVSYADTEKTYQAFMKLDFIVVNEIFPSPTTAIADIVLPAAWGAEHDGVSYWPVWYGEFRAYPKLVEPPGEAWPDTKIITEVAERLGMGQYFWKDEKDVFNHMLQPSGLQWEEFKPKRILPPRRGYQNPEDGIFKTPSGKVEIYSSRLKELGYSAMPLWEELSNLRYELSEEYPLLLINRKEEVYMLTGYKHVSLLRKKKPQPTVELHPETAKKAGVEEGDWVHIETHRGMIKQMVRLDRDLDPRVVVASFGWWFPEEPEDLYQFRKANVNVLTDCAPPYEPMVGTVELRGVPCRVYGGSKWESSNTSRPDD